MKTADMVRGGCYRGLVWAPAAAATLLWLAPSSLVVAQDEVPAPDVELFGGTNLDEAGQAGFGPAFGAALQLEPSVASAFRLHIGVALMLLTPDQNPDAVFWFGSRLGARIHWGKLFGIGGGQDGWLDVHHNFGRSSNTNRHGFDAGTGYQFLMTQMLSVGPFVRFWWASGAAGADPMMILFGAAAQLVPDGTADIGPDRDNDRIPDDEDICPLVPEGNRPDEDREGCPARDTDGDGLVDPDDACPAESMWPNPDPSPERPGCPLADRDGDGVADINDVCPEQPGSGDPLREGCPPGQDPGF